MRAPVTAAVCAALLCPVLLYQIEDGYQAEDLYHDDPVDITPEYSPCPTDKVLRSRETCQLDGIKFQCIKLRCCDGHTFVAGRCIQETVDPCSLQLCEQKCVVKGSVVWCSCHSGFQFNRDNYHAKTQPYCVDVNECEINNGGCSEKCVNDPGSFHCECSHPRVLGSDGKRCDLETFTSMTTTDLQEPLPLLRASSRCYATCDIVNWLTKKVKHLTDQLRAAQMAIKKLMENPTPGDGSDRYSSGFASSYQVLDATVPLQGGFCRCERGPRGPAGPRGMDGPPGPRGPRGRQGPKSSFDLILLMIADLRHDISQLEARVYKDGERPERFNLLKTWSDQRLKIIEKHKQATTTPANQEAYTYPASEETFANETSEGENLIRSSSFSTSSTEADTTTQSSASTVEGSEQSKRKTSIREMIHNALVNWTFVRDDSETQDVARDMAILEKIRQYYILANLSGEFDDEEPDDNSDYSFD